MVSVDMVLAIFLVLFYPVSVPSTNIYILLNFVLTHSTPLATLVATLILPNY